MKIRVGLRFVLSKKSHLMGMTVILILLMGGFALITRELGNQRKNEIVAWMETEGGEITHQYHSGVLNFSRNELIAIDSALLAFQNELDGMDVFSFCSFENDTIRMLIGSSSDLSYFNTSLQKIQFTDTVGRLVCRFSFSAEWIIPSWSDPLRKINRYLPSMQSRLIQLTNVFFKLENHISSFNDMLEEKYRGLMFVSFFVFSLLTVVFSNILISLLRSLQDELNALEQKLEKRGFLFKMSAKNLFFAVWGISALTTISMVRLAYWIDEALVFGFQLMVLIAGNRANLYRSTPKSLIQSIYSPTGILFFFGAGMVLLFNLLFSDLMDGNLTSHIVLIEFLFWLVVTHWLAERWIWFIMDAFMKKPPIFGKAIRHNPLRSQVFLRAIFFGIMLILLNPLIINELKIVKEMETMTTKWGDDTLIANTDILMELPNIKLEKVKSVLALGIKTALLKTELFESEMEMGFIDLRELLSFSKIRIFDSLDLNLNNQSILISKRVSERYLLEMNEEVSVEINGSWVKLIVKGIFTNFGSLYNENGGFDFFLPSIAPLVDKTILGIKTNNGYNQQMVMKQLEKATGAEIENWETNAFRMSKLSGTLVAVINITGLLSLSICVMLLNLLISDIHRHKKTLQMRGNVNLDFRKFSKAWLKLFSSLVVPSIIVSIAFLNHFIYRMIPPFVFLELIVSNFLNLFLQVIFFSTFLTILAIIVNIELFISQVRR